MWHLSSPRDKNGIFHKLQFYLWEQATICLIRWAGAQVMLEKSQWNKSYEMSWKQMELN